MDKIKGQSMITVHMSGGLGNQMFQYAAGFALAKKLGTILVLDTSSFLRDAVGRKFDLNKYSVTARAYSPLTAYFIKKLSKHNKIFVEVSNIYDPKLLQQPDNTYLLGHWQSEKYFKKYKSLIRNEFRYTLPLSAAAQSLYSKIKSNRHSVSIHIRRGDYVTNKVASDVLGVLPLIYYKKAIKIIASKISKPTYYIFSDDQKWVRDNLLIKDVVFVDTNSSHEDLELMRACRHHIIANSSYSWWGAWLGSYEGDITITPKKWFRDAKFSSNDLVPSRWMAI